MVEIPKCKAWNSQIEYTIDTICLCMDYQGATYLDTCILNFGVPEYYKNQKGHEARGKGQAVNRKAMTKRDSSEEVFTKVGLAIPIL